MSTNKTVKELKEDIIFIWKKIYKKNLTTSEKAIIPSSFRKQQLILYIEGLNKMLKEKIPMTIPVKSWNSTLVPIYMDSNIDPFTHLKTEGWATIKIPDLDPDLSKQNFLNWLSGISDDFEIDDPTTWINDNLPLRLHGILKHYIGHTNWIWKIRELCAPIFSQIYQVDPKDLLTSFDGGCFLYTGDKVNTKTRPWFHLDQGRELPDFSCIQGVVNLIDNGPEDGGLIIVERSKEIFKEYWKTHPIDGLTGFTQVNINHELIKGRRCLKICAPKGHILLWDSRMIHTNQPPKNLNTLRMCTYVSMMPRVNATKKILDKRCQWYEKGRMTSHWCYGPYFSVNSKDPRTYGKYYPKPKLEEIETSSLNDLTRRLVGYD